MYMNENQGGMKLVDEIYLNFPELFVIGKDVKIRFKSRLHCVIFSVLEIIKSKILQKLNKRVCFYLHSWLHFYGVSCAKAALHKHMM